MTEIKGIHPYADEFPLASDDPLPAFDFGGALRVDAQELDLWVERHRMGAA